MPCSPFKMGRNQSIEHSESFSFSNQLCLITEYNCADIVLYLMLYKFLLRKNSTFSQFDLKLDLITVG